MQEFIITGHLCDQEFYTKIVCAKSVRDAEKCFEQWVRESSDDNHSDFYIDLSKPLAQMQSESIKSR